MVPDRMTFEGGIPGTAPAPAEDDDDAEAADNPAWGGESPEDAWAGRCRSANPHQSSYPSRPILRAQLSQSRRMGLAPCVNYPAVDMYHAPRSGDSSKQERC